MKLAEELIAEDKTLQLFTDWRMHEVAYADKMAVMKRMPAFDSASSDNQNLIKAICRLQHLANWIKSYIEALEKQSEDLTLPPAMRSIATKQFSTITQALFRYLAADHHVGDAELEAILEPEDKNSLGYVKAIVSCFPDRSNFYKAMAKQSVKKYGESVTDFIKEQASVPFSGTPLVCTPIADMATAAKKVPESKPCCIM